MTLSFFENCAFLFQKEHDQPPIPQISQSPEAIQFREILLSWVAEMSEKLDHWPKTTELAIRYVDHYLSIYQISSDYLQLLGLTCLNLAQKIIQNQEIIKDDLQSLMVIFCGEHKFEELINLEQIICQSIKWNFNLVTPSDYLGELEGQVPLNKIKDLILYMMMSNKFDVSNNYEIFLSALKKSESTIQLSSYLTEELNTKVDQIVYQLGVELDGLFLQFEGQEIIAQISNELPNASPVAEEYVISEESDEEESDQEQSFPKVLKKSHINQCLIQDESTEEQVSKQNKTLPKISKKIHKTNN